MTAALMLMTMPLAAQDLQQKLAAAKENAALNQQALRSYSWLEKTEISLKGEVKGTKVDMCRYGPDGKVQKTPVVEPPPPQQKRGLKGRIVAKKTEEMKDELEAAVALVQQYVPPSPDMIQVVMNAGTASLSQAGPGRASLTFPGYAKANDALTLTFDTAVKALQQRRQSQTFWCGQVDRLSPRSVSRHRRVCISSAHDESASPRPSPGE
jgi:hypothetical protein